MTESEGMPETHLDLSANTRSACFGCMNRKKQGKLTWTAPSLK